MKQKTPLGYWEGGNIRPEPYEEIITAALQDVLRPIYLVKKNDVIHIARDGNVAFGPAAAQLKSPDAEGRYPLVAVVPPLPPKSLGDPYFKSLLGLEYAYVVGAMANGITSVEMVEAAARAGMVGFFGAAGLDVASIEQAIGQLKQRLGDLPYGFNLIHSPGDPELEFATVRLYLEHGIDLVSA